MRFCILVIERKGNNICQLRFRNDKGDTEFFYTLNGSGLALPRVVPAILETYQQEDGTIEVPEVLQPFMGTEYVA